MIKEAGSDDDDDECKLTLRSLMYTVCTDSKLYSGCEVAINVMLFNVGVSTNECGIESLISTIGAHNHKGRPISLDQLHHELVVCKNGPNPLHTSTDKFLRDSLTHHFGGGPDKWNFCHGNMFKSATSQVIARQINSCSKPKL